MVESQRSSSSREALSLAGIESSWSGHSKVADALGGVSAEGVSSNIASVSADSANADSVNDDSVSDDSIDRGEERRGIP